MVAAGQISSTREVWNELDRTTISRPVHQWAKQNRQIFTTPTGDELKFVATILRVSHFQQLIGSKQQLMGTPVADPFVVSCAKTRQGTVVTQEQLKPNAAKIPNVCQHFQVPCVNLEAFMTSQRWSF